MKLNSAVWSVPSTNRTCNLRQVPAFAGFTPGGFTIGEKKPV
jgi:hypothetical protein